MIINTIAGYGSTNYIHTIHNTHTHTHTHIWQESSMTSNKTVPSPSRTKDIVLNLIKNRFQMRELLEPV